MNEKIKELLAKAHLDVMENLGDMNTNYVAEKFAELIVRECGRVYIQNQQDGVMTLTQDLLQHFGVTE